MADSENETLKSSASNEKLEEASPLDIEQSQFAEEDLEKTAMNEVPDGASEKSGAFAQAAGLETQLADWKAKVVYLSAEIENMRKRFTRERTELLKMASEDVLKSLLPVFDNISYALRAAKDSEKGESASPVVSKLVLGVEMTLKHFEQTLEQQGVATIKTVGTPFDPALHEAVGQTELPEFDNDVVSTEVQKGFKLYARVLRPARVLVNKK